MKTINEKQSIFSKFEYYTQRKSIRYGIPFLVLILGGSFGLKEFAQLRYVNVRLSLNYSRICFLSM